MPNQSFQGSTIVRRCVLCTVIYQSSHASVSEKIYKGWGSVGAGMFSPFNSKTKLSLDVVALSIESLRLFSPAKELLKALLSCVIFGVRTQGGQLSRDNKRSLSRDDNCNLRTIKLKAL